MTVDLLRDDLLRVRSSSPAASEDLEAWARAAGVVPVVNGPAVTRSPPGPCHICHAPEAAMTCLHCHREVCKAHAWLMLGLCHECLTPEELHRARTGTERPRPALDVSWVED